MGQFFPNEMSLGIWVHGAAVSKSVSLRMKCFLEFGFIGNFAQLIFISESVSLKG